MVYEPMKLKIPDTTWLHYGDVVMGTVASQITSLTIVYSTVYSGADQRKHQSSSSQAFVRGIHRGPVNSPHKWPVTRKMFPFNDVIMSLGHDDLKPMWPSDAIWQHRPGLTLTQPLPEPMSAYHWWGPVTITWGGFHKRYLNHQIQILAWTLLIQHFIPICQGTLSEVAVVGSDLHPYHRHEFPSRHSENCWAFTEPKGDFDLILLILNMIIHKSF